MRGSNVPEYAFSGFDIQPGENIEEIINNKLENAKVILCLIDADYISTQAEEIAKIETFFELKTKRIIPITVKECLYGFPFLEKLRSISLEKEEKVNPEKLWLKVAKFLNFYIQDEFRPESSQSNFTIAPYKAAAGQSMDYDQLKIMSTDTIKLKNYQKGDMLFEITGHSMVPYVNDGDYVHARKCDNRREIIDGKIFVIETSTEGIMIKKIHNNSSSLTLTSINEEFKDFNIEKSTISEMWSIVSVLNINYK